MKIPRYVLLAANIVLWGYFVWSGWDGMQSIAGQHVSGYPNAGQSRYYVLFPVIVFFAAVVPTVLLWRTEWANFGTGWLIVTLLLLFPYAYFYTGGV